MTESDEVALARIQHLESELEEMTAALAQAWDQLVPFLQTTPESAGSSVNIMPLLESVMASVDAPYGAVYLQQRDENPAEWRTVPNDAFSLRTLQQHLEHHDPRDLLRLNGTQPWTGQPTYWMFVPMVVDGSVAGAIGVGFDASRHEVTNVDTRLLRRMAERVSAQIIAVSLAESRAREAQIAHELQIAGMIQRSIQPTSVPQIEGVRVASDWMPAATVGGDAWGWTLQPSGRLAFYVLDVAGKGLPASLGAVSLRAAVQMVLRLDLDPAQALHAVNREFYSAYTDAGIMATLNIFTVDPANGLFVQANAGHNPTLIRRGGQWHRLPANTPPIGVQHEIDPQIQTLRLNSGDAILCYSDGLSEIETSAGMWGEAGILTALQTAFSDPESMLSGLLSSAEQMRLGRPPSDDQTVLCMMFDGTPQTLHRQTIVIPAEPASLEALDPFVHAIDGRLDETLRMQVLLALHELCLNIVEHGYAGDSGVITVEGFVDAGMLTFQVTDQAPRSYTPPVIVSIPDPDSLPEGGWGISIMHSVMDQIHYERADGQNFWLMKKSLSESEA